uniref:RNA-directed DNA polymerase, eukaryota, reverse transcriptase zinc-binding domain protein n=1 Tax=Tanacetum cinerariifolium TaxID=118510 RepID=A0A6L2JUA1_TANCI|nr:RNA-directed DNA polymerase, eukaryota, reverse transcriptase zinc-binding domain protein [Tanacetum cinerariifolium]
MNKGIHQANSNINVKSAPVEPLKRARVPEISSSYIQAVKTGTCSHTDVKDSKPALVLDDSCLYETDYTLSMVSKLNKFGSLPNLKKILMEEGFADINIRYMGGFWVPFKFLTKVTKDNFMSHVGVNSWFSKLQQASNSFSIDERMLWRYLQLVIDGWKGDVIVMSDFNEVRIEDERSGSIFNACGLLLLTLLFLQVVWWRCPMEVGKKLKLLKGHIRLWVKGKKDKALNLKKYLKIKLVALDASIDKGNVTSGTLEDRMANMNNLTSLVKMKSIELAQKAKIKWSIEGDENTKHYHGIINKQRNNLAIRGIIVEEDWIEEPHAVKNEFLSHFRDRFDNPGVFRLILDMDFPNNLSPDQIQDLERMFTKKAIKRAVYDCGLVNLQVLIGSHSASIEGGNSSFVSLIPKTQGAKMVKDFRPISTTYKIIAKLLANRLVTVVGGLVNEVQSAFIANRQILDGPFILNKIIHWSKAKKKQTMIFKVDFKKAFDSVRWDFLDDVLRKFGFGTRWRDWIQSCLKSSRGSILVNGSPTSELQFYKGLKQGDPLSAFLFILVMESLHLSFQKVVNVGLFKGQWCDSNISTIIRVLYCFFRASGLRINLQKIKLLGIAVKNSMVDLAANSISFMTLNLSFSYLHFFNGVAPNVRKMTFVQWDHVLASKDKVGLGVSSFYALNQDGEFSVSSARNIIDDKTLGSSAPKHIGASMFRQRWCQEEIYMSDFVEEIVEGINASNSDELTDQYILDIPPIVDDEAIILFKLDDLKKGAIYACLAGRYGGQMYDRLEDRRLCVVFVRGVKLRDGKEEILGIFDLRGFGFKNSNLSFF